MQISEVARRSGVTIKAVRYYEELGIVVPRRLPNGYRDYDETHLRAVIEIRELAASGITARQATPFIACLALGHQHGDDCVSSLAAYRDAIAEIGRVIDTLQNRRAQLLERLDSSASRTFLMENTMPDFVELPTDLPEPVDDGAAAHLVGAELPDLTLPATDGTSARMADFGEGRTVIYFYPLTGRPGTDLPEGWDSIPGARGCTTEACDFRDHHEDLRGLGVDAVYGVSSQGTEYQAEVAVRLRLPFTMLSDERFRFSDALNLPTFQAPGHDRLYSRLTLIVRGRRIEHVFYPIFPPNTHAQQVVTWLENPAE